MRLLAIGCVVGEFDAEMSAAGKADNEHRLADARPLHGPHRAAQEGLKALSQFPAPMRAREDVHVAAQSDHDLPALPEGSWSQPEPGPLTVASSHKTQIAPSGHAADRSVGGMALGWARHSDLGTLRVGGQGLPLTLAVFHTSVCPSPYPAAMVCPSGLNAIARMPVPDDWSAKVAIRECREAAQRYTLPFASPTAMVRPSGLNATEAAIWADGSVKVVISE